jgi:hypothetical protein
MRSQFILALFLASGSAQAREQYGVRMPDTVTVEGRQLKLNGMGLRRKKMIFTINVYVAGFYAEAPSKNARELINADQGKRMTLYMLRDLDKGKITDALREGFEKNSKAQLPVLKDRLDRLSAMIPDAKKGSTIVITYVPGTGTVLAGAGERSIIEGKDFADALFSVWLGRNAADDDLKAGLLGAGE